MCHSVHLAKKGFLLLQSNVKSSNKKTAQRWEIENLKILCYICKLIANKANIVSLNK